MSQTRSIILMMNNFAAECHFSFSNDLLRSPLRYTMMERRFLYRLSEEIKKRYAEYGLSVKHNWDNLCFRMTDNDLKILGGDKNARRTYSVIKHLADRTVLQYDRNEKGEVILAYYHWIDAFRWNMDTKDYTVRVSPELYDYLVNLTKRFSILNLHTAIRLRSKYSQKFYELCCLYSGDFRYVDPKFSGLVYKKRVLKMRSQDFRFLFGLTELRDPKTNEVLAKAKYSRFQRMVDVVIKPAQQELYGLYQDGICDVWFDYLATDCNSLKESPTTLVFFVHSRRHPKSKIASKDRPWQEGDEPLYLFEAEKQENESNIKLSIDRWKELDVGQQHELVISLLNQYLKKSEISYYLKKIEEEQLKCNNAYAQVIQVIYEKTRQPKFPSQTPAYKRKNLIEFAFKENLKEFGWSISPKKWQLYRSLNILQL